MTTIYVDSRKRVAGSDSDFEVDLGESLHLQSDARLTVYKIRPPSPSAWTTCWARASSPAGSRVFEFVRMMAHIMALRGPVTLRHMRFRLTDLDGNVVRLRGSKQG